MSRQDEFNSDVIGTLRLILDALSQLEREVAALRRKDAAADICERDGTPDASAIREQGE